MHSAYMDLQKRNRINNKSNMNKAKIIYTFLIINLFVSSALSQSTIVSLNQVPKSTTKTPASGVMTRTVPLGDRSSMPSPSDDSERIKYKIKIEKDSAFYSLKGDVIEKGVIDDRFPGAIVLNNKVFKGNEILFEVVPDISKPNIMTLYTYMPGGTSFKYLFCDNNGKIKYKKFEVADQLKNNLIPLILCYVDNEKNDTEKLLEKYLKDNLISITSNEELQEKILKYIEKYLFVYYNLSDK